MKLSLCPVYLCCTSPWYTNVYIDVREYGDFYSSESTVYLHVLLLICVPVHIGSRSEEINNKDKYKIIHHHRVHSNL